MRRRPRNSDRARRGNSEMSYESIGDCALELSVINTLWKSIHKSKRTVTNICTSGRESAVIEAEPFTYLTKIAL
jgi:hypothetical protein